jgi:hypothetical protein
MLLNAKLNPALKKSNHEKTLLVAVILLTGLAGYAQKTNCYRHSKPINGNKNISIRF